MESISQESANDYKIATAYLIIQLSIMGCYWPSDVSLWAKSIIWKEERVGIEIIRSAINKELSQSTP